MNDLAEQIELARKTIRQQKKATPWMFTEYHIWQSLLKRENELRRLRLAAEEKWRKLGNE